MAEKPIRVIDQLAERAKVVIKKNWVDELLSFMRDNEIGEPLEFDYRNIPIAVQMVYWPNKKLPATHGAQGSQTLVFRKMVQGVGWTVIDDDFEAQVICRSLFSRIEEAPKEEKEVKDGDPT